MPQIKNQKEKEGVKGVNKGKMALANKPSQSLFHQSLKTDQKDMKHLAPVCTIHY